MQIYIWYPYICWYVAWICLPLCQWIWTFTCGWHENKKEKCVTLFAFFLFQGFFSLRLSVQIFNIMHYLIVPRILSISFIYSVNSFILINCAVQAWRDCCNYERLRWTWVSCSNWFIPWWDEVHGHPRGTRSCYSREEGQNSTSHLWTRLNSCKF